MKIAAMIIALLTALAGGVLTYFASQLMGPFAFPIWGSLGLVSIATLIGMGLIQEKPGTASTIFCWLAIAWFCVGLPLGKPINLFTAPFILGNALACGLAAWARYRTEYAELRGDSAPAISDNRAQIAGQDSTATS